MQTIVIGIKKMIVTADAITEWQLVMATAMLAMLPPVAVVVPMQKLFVRGLVETETVVSDGCVILKPRHVDPQFELSRHQLDGADEIFVSWSVFGCGLTLLRMIRGNGTMTADEDRERVVMKSSGCEIAMVSKRTC